MVFWLERSAVQLGYKVRIAMDIGWVIMQWNFQGVLKRPKYSDLSPVGFQELFAFFKQND